MTVMDLRRRARPIAFWALAAIALLVAHDAVFLAQVGPGADLTRALRSAGHDYWAFATALVLLAGLVAAAIVMRRIVRLHRTASALDISIPSAPGRHFAARVPALWLRLFVVVTVGFAIQENVEHVIGHAHLLGVGALVGPEYPLALPVIGLITLVAAGIGAAIITVEHDLVVGIVAALARCGHRPPRRIVRPPARIGLTRIPLLARAGAGRAPPALLAAI